MINKSLTAIVAALITLSSSVAIAQNHDHEHEEEPTAVEYKLINQLRYHKEMYEAVNSNELMRIPYGAKLDSVGGFSQDKNGATNGLPMTFRPTENPDEAWILDSINMALKLFKAGKLVKSISIKKEMGIITDFAFNKAGDKVAFLNQISGKVYVTNDKGDLLNTISGFEYATSIEYMDNNNLLIVSPLSKGVVKVSDKGAPLGIYEADQSLSNFSSEKGVWGLECSGGQVAKLFVRNEEIDSVKVIAEIPFKDYEDVEYKGGNIYGFDKEGNIYFGLVACDPNGIIYRDRIYKADQNGNIINTLDVLDKPIISPHLPRHRIACPDGRILTFFSEEDKTYYLLTYSLK